MAPISSIAVETVRFDMQKIENPEISGAEYQQGELLGYEIREYLLEKWGRKCVYCNAEDTRLEIDHITPKSKGGSNRVSNLTISCRACNVLKANNPISEFLKNKSPLCSKILNKAKVPLDNAAAVNSTRKKVAKMLGAFSLPITCSSGGQTKFNRVTQGYEKDHWIDAACVSASGRSVHIASSITPLLIKATGRGSRQFCRMDRYGFPRTSAKTQKRVHGFKTGDLVKAIVTKGVKTGTHFGRIAVRSSGNFCLDISTGKVDGVSYKYCQRIHHSDGYSYLLKKQKKEQRFLPVLKNGVSALSKG